MNTNKLESVGLLFQVLLCTALLISLTTAAVAEETRPETAKDDDKTEEAEVYKTPQAAFEAAQTAFNDREWGDFYELIAPEARGPVVGGLGAGIAYLSKLDASNTKARQLVNKHLPEGFDASVLLVGNENREDAIKQLETEIKEPAEFFAEAMPLLMSNQKGEQQIVSMDNYQVAQDGQSATGTVVLRTVIEEQPQDTSTPWGFRKVDESWYITMQERRKK